MIFSVLNNFILSHRLVVKLCVTLLKKSYFLQKHFNIYMYKVKTRSKILTKKSIKKNCQNIVSKFVPKKFCKNLSEKNCQKNLTEKIVLKQLFKRICVKNNIWWKKNCRKNLSEKIISKQICRKKCQKNSVKYKFYEKRYQQILPDINSTKCQKNCQKFF